jgi:hypothetical protein
LFNVDPPLWQRGESLAMTVPVARIGGALALAMLAFAAGEARADAARAVCFIGPVFLDGVADDACVSGEKERKRLLNLAVVDAARKPIPLLMRAEGKAKDKVTVTTCRKWWQAVSLSRVAMRAQDRSREGYYERTCLMLDQLKFGAPARKVYLTAKGRDLSKPDRVPARLLEQAGIKGPLPLPGATVADLSKAGELVIRDRKRAMLEVIWRSADIELSPVARGDFDRDGLGDLAIAMKVVVRGGKRRGLTIVFVTRRSGRGQLEVIYPKARGSE